MKTILKIILKVLLTALAVIAVVILVLYLLGKFVPLVPSDYQTKIQTGGELEARYMASGKYEVASCDESVKQDFEKYMLFYPGELSGSADKYPVIVLCNNVAAPLSKYTVVAKHFASWGFIVIGTEDSDGWNGYPSEMCICYLEQLNENKLTADGRENIFCGKIDLENVGITGFFYGGIGMVNAVAVQPHSAVFKTAVALYPIAREQVKELNDIYHYDTEKVSIPTLLISINGTYGEDMEEVFNDIGGDKVMLRRKDTTYNEMLYAANGYVTAWFMWQLQGDEAAAAAFAGDAPEILTNSLYQDQKISLGGAKLPE